jgi:hypothetical protein
MKRIEIYLVGFSCFLGSMLACNKALTPTRPTYETPLAVQVDSIPKVELVDTNAQGAEMAMLNDALSDLNNVLASDCFQADVLAGQFTETNNLTNQEIYDLFRLKPIQIAVTMYSGSWVENHLIGVIGYYSPAYPNTVFQNRHFVSDHFKSASNLLHEIAHILGFNHDLVYSTSVPYQMNDIFQECAGELGIAVTE